MATYKVRVSGTASGQLIQNVFHVVHSGDATPDQLAGSLRNAWQANLLFALSGVYAFQGVEVENIADDSAVGYAGATSPAVGQAAGAALPTAVTFSTILKTSRRGRAGTGRMALSPVPEAFTQASDPNLLDSGSIAGVNDILGNFLEDIQSSGGNAAMTMAVVSYRTTINGVPNTLRPSPLVSLVTSWTVRPRVGTQLSRHPGR